MDIFLRSLSFSEKLLFFSSTIWIISSFFTWFSTKEFTDWMLVSYNAFTWIWAVLWYFYFIFMISIFILIILKWTNLLLSNFLKRQNWIYLFLSWEALFVSVCTMLIYSSYSFGLPYASIWFWLYLAIISQVVGLFWAHYFLISNYSVRR